MMEQLKSILIEAIQNEWSKAILSGSLDSDYHRVEIVKKKNNYQIIRYTEKQAFHTNVAEDEIISQAITLFESYKQMNLFYAHHEVSIRKTKKGYLQISKKQSQIKMVNAEHNRQKNYLIPEGEVIPPLVDMGIFTQEGKVVASMQDKYRQINKFIEIIDDGLRKFEGTKLNVVDFGCGKSYLTFILYYYLREVKKLEVEIIGLDLKEEVIQHCNEAAKKYHYEHLRFEVGNIEGYHSDQQIDMVITLHACDTATDYALYHAVNWNASMIFSVPCCQHELNSQIESESFNIITRYGIAKERISALFTDIIRCNLLKACGYQVQLLEFVDLSHTPKNMLIRANKSKIPDNVRNLMLDEVRTLIKEYHLDPTLLRLLQNSKKIEEEF